MNKIIFLSNKHSLLVLRTIILFIILIFQSQISIAGNNVVLKQERMSIVIVPFYKEIERDYNNEEIELFQRIIGIISNMIFGQFIVIDDLATDYKEEDYYNYWKLAKKKTSDVAKLMCKQYTCDIACIVRVEKKLFPTSDGYHTSKTTIEVKCYDSTARRIMYLLETSAISRLHYEDAERESQTVAAKLIGHKLYLNLHNKAKKYQNLITVRLQGNFTYLTFEMFNRILNSIEGIGFSRLRTQNITPDDSLNIAIWDVKIDSNVMSYADFSIVIRKGINKFSSEGNIWGYSPKDISSLKKIYPSCISPREVLLVANSDYKNKYLSMDIFSSFNWYFVSFILLSSLFIFCRDKLGIFAQPRKKQ